MDKLPWIRCVNMAESLMLFCAVNPGEVSNKRRMSLIVCFILGCFFKKSDRVNHLHHQQHLHPGRGHNLSADFAEIRMTGKRRKVV
jgi:hypothetical protein